MRRSRIAVALLILLAACGGGDDTGDSASTTSTADGTTAGSNTASSVDVDLEFAVADWGVSPDRSLGPSQALGSGCSPDSDLLPDGVWYGWVTSFGAEQVDFDLACLWPGELEIRDGRPILYIHAGLIAG